MSVFLVIKQYTLPLSMIQQFYLIYCMMVYYELVSHSTRQATLDFMFMYSVEQSPHSPYCLLFAAQEGPEQV